MLKIFKSIKKCCSKVRSMFCSPKKAAQEPVVPVVPAVPVMATEHIVPVEDPAAVAAAAASAELVRKRAAFRYVPEPAVAISPEEANRRFYKAMKEGQALQARLQATVKNPKTIPTVIPVQGPSYYERKLAQKQRRQERRARLAPKPLVKINAAEEIRSFSVSSVRDRIHRYELEVLCKTNSYLLDRDVNWDRFCGTEATKV